jgi:DNA-binding NtrC family response regulator
VTNLDVVLVVDADPAARRAAAAALPADRYRLVYAASADAALHLLVTEPVSVLVTELVLPGPGGLSVLVEARRARPYVARIVVTAAPELEAAVEAINAAEVLRFLRKPLESADLRAAVDDALAWAAAAEEVDRARGARARRRRALDALATEHRGLLPAESGPDGYSIPLHRLRSLAGRLAATPLGDVLAAAVVESGVGDAPTARSRP